MTCGRRHVVLADSNDDSREMYAEYLEYAGIRVTAVESAVDGLEAVRREQPDAVVTFLRFRGLDGFALCDALQAAADTAHIPVIGLSTCQPDHDRARQVGFAAVLMIPCVPSVLLELLCTMWGAGASAPGCPVNSLLTTEDVCPGMPI